MHTRSLTRPHTRPHTQAMNKFRSAALHAGFQRWREVTNYLTNLNLFKAATTIQCFCRTYAANVRWRRPPFRVAPAMWLCLPVSPSLPVFLSPCPSVPVPPSPPPLVFCPIWSGPSACHVVVSPVSCLSVLVSTVLQISVCSLSVLSSVRLMIVCLHHREVSGS
jgi:hypothetical protein